MVLGIMGQHAEAAECGEHTLLELTRLPGIGTDALAQILDFVFTDGQTGHMTRGEMLLHVATHNAYHRGGAGRALSIYNQTLPKDGLAAFVATQVRNFAQNPAVTGHL